MPRAGILAPILFGIGTPPVTGTNIGRINGTGAYASGTTQVVAPAYTCSSTSNRVFLFSLTSYNGPLTLTDTGGEASGATLVGSGSDSANQHFAAWTTACYSGANTYTSTWGGAGSDVGGLLLWEYSGTGTGTDGLTFTRNVGSATSCTVAGTATHAGDLEIVVQQFGNTWLQSTTVTRLIGVNNSGVQLPDSGGNSNLLMADNLYAPNGSVSYTGNFASANNAECFMMLVPGTAATSPGFYPQTIQTRASCTSTSTNPTFASHQNVQSGSVMTFDFGYNGSTVPSAVTGSTCGAYTLQVTKASGTSNEELVYTCKTASSGAETVTVTGSFGNYPCGTVTEHSGVASVTPTDTGGNTTGAATMTWSQTVTNNLSFVHAACSSTGAGPVSVTGTGFYAIAAANPLLSASIAEEAVVPMSGTSTPSLTFSSSNTHTVCASIVLQ